MSSKISDGAVASPPTTSRVATQSTQRTGSSRGQHAADTTGSAQPDSSAQETGNRHQQQQQHAAHAVHHAQPQAANGMEADGVWGSSADGKPGVPRAGGAHRHARSTSGLSAGSVTSVDFEQTAQPEASSGFGDQVYVRSLRCWGARTP